MSLTLNMVGGGGGKLKDTDAVLVVTVPTGSTVTATKGGTTLTPTMWVKAADNTLDCAIFSIPASQFDSTTPWTVTATLGTETASATVLISENAEYDIELSYRLYIIANGLFQNGYSFVHNLRKGYTPSIAENVGGYLTVSMPTDFSRGSATDLIDLTPFSSLCVEGYKSGGTVYVGAYDSYNYSSESAMADAGIAKATLGTTESIKTVDISDLQVSAYIGCAIVGESGNTAYIKNLWLE